MRLTRNARCLPLPCILGLTLGCIAARSQVPAVSGQVTDAVSPTSFSVNGHPIVCDSKTEFTAFHLADASRVSWTQKPYLGEPLQVYGREDGKAHSIHASRIVFAPQDPQLHGRGIIDQLLPSPPGGRLLRADGYRILINSATLLTFAEPLHSIGDVQTNQWLEYQGHLRSDGILVAERAHLQPNIVAAREQQLQQKYAYDPKQAAPAPRPGDMTGYVGRVLSPHDPKHIPPAHDAALEQRLETISQRLIPRYQSNLPQSDSSRIEFRFQLIDDRHIHQCVALPNGILLMPREVAVRLDNDDQFAAYIASCMAVIIEKQQLRFQRELRILNAPAVTALAVAQPLFLPAASSRDDLLLAEMQESVRVALVVMHDAGYDITEAPKAWWMLASEKKEPITEIAIPDEAVYAYAMLGALWRQDLGHGTDAAP